MFDSVQLLGFGLLCSLTLIHSLYVISIRQTGVLLPSSFRFHLAMDTLDFSYILPTVGRIWDFHPLETCAAVRTQNGHTLRNESMPDFYSLSQYCINSSIFSTIRLCSAMGGSGSNNCLNISNGGIFFIAEPLLLSLAEFFKT